MHSSIFAVLLDMRHWVIVDADLSIFLSQNFPKFIQGLIAFLGLSLPAAVVNSGLRYFIAAFDPGTCAC